MYTRKIYEPESKFSLQTARTPGASARGNAHGDKGTELPSSKVPAWTTIDTSVEKTVQQRRKNGSGQLEPVSLYRAKERVLDEDVPNLFRVDTAIVEHHVKNYVNDFGRWYSQSMREIGDMGWSERRSSVVPLERKAEEFSNRNDELRMYIDVNKDKLDHEYYTTVASFLTDQKTNTEGLRELHRTKREMLEQFDSQASYDAFLADQAERQRLLDLDIERQREEIDSLKVTLEEFTENDRQYRLTSINPFAALNKNSAGIISRNQELRGLYGSPEEMEEMIESMQRECEEARRLQARVKIPQTVMMAPDFETMSRYTPIEIDIGSNGIGDAIYTFINMQDNSDDGLKMWRDTLFSDYRYLTEKEIRIFNYCYNTGNYEIGKAYLDGLTETLNQRKAERRFEDFEGKTGKEILYGIDVGLDQFASGIYATGKMLFGDESDPVISEQEFLAGMIREDLKDNGAKLPQWMGGASLSQTAYDAVATASYMLPNELAAIAANAVLPGSGKIVGNAMVWASAGGNAYTEAKRMGFGEEQASAYALLIGGSEAGLGWLLGGIEKLGGGLTQKLIGKVLPRVDNAAAKVAMRYGGNIIAEGNEEYLQTILEPVFKKIALNINEDIDWEEAAYAWFLGVLSSAEIGGAEIVADFGKRIGITDPKLLGNALRDYDPASLGETGKTGPTPVLAPVEKASPEMWTPLQPRTQPDRAADSGTQPEIPYFTPDIRTNELDGLWTETDADMWTQSDAETQQKPLRHEDQPRSYPDGDTSPSANAEVLTVSSPESGPVADMDVIPKPKEQIISELAPKISKPGITPGRAAIAAQEMYAEAEKWYGSKADAVLEMFQPGQDPRKFLDGVQNAYLAGKMGKEAALKNSTAAANLTEEQRNYAFELGKSVDDYRIHIKEERQEQGLAELNWPPRGAPITREAYKEIMRYARDRKIELAGFKHYDGDIDAIKKMVDDVKRISECFPGLADERRRLTIELGRTLDDDTFAQTHGRIIKINMNAYRNSKKLETEYQKLVEEGWFVKGTNSRAIVAHEMGHVVEMVFGIDALSLVHEATGLKRDEVVDFCQENLSFYSAAYSDGSEIISECFASVFGSSENNEFALNIVERCANIVARKGVTLD